MYGKYECFVMHMFYVCVLCISCDSSQCCVMEDLQFLNAGIGCKRRPHGRGILQSRSHNCLVGTHECLLLFTPSCCRACFYDLCACTEMLRMYVLYVSFGSKVRPITFGCVAMRSALLCILRPRYLYILQGLA